MWVCVSLYQQNDLMAKDVEWKREKIWEKSAGSYF